MSIHLNKIARISAFGKKMTTSFFRFRGGGPCHVAKPFSDLSIRKARRRFARLERNAARAPVRQALSTGSKPRVARNLRRSGFRRFYSAIILGSLIVAPLRRRPVVGMGAAKRAVAVTLLLPFAQIAPRGRTLRAHTMFNASASTRLVGSLKAVNMMRLIVFALTRSVLGSVLTRDF